MKLAANPLVALALFAGVLAADDDSAKPAPVAAIEASGDAARDQAPAAGADSNATPRPIRFVHYVSHGQRAMPVFTELMTELWKKDVGLSVGHPGEPAADQLRIEVTIDESSDWKEPVADLLTEISKLPVRPMALSCGPTQFGMGKTKVTLAWSTETPRAEIDAVEAVLKQQERVKFEVRRIDNDFGGSSGSSSEVSARPDASQDVANEPRRETSDESKSAISEAMAESTTTESKDVSENKGRGPAEEFSSTPLVVFDDPTASKSTRDAIQLWVEKGLVRRRDPESESESPQNSLELFDLGSPQGETALSILEELRKLQIPLSVRISRTANTRPTPNSDPPAATARLGLDAAADPRPIQRITDLLKGRGIAVTATREPSLSLWIIHSTFEPVGEAHLPELKKVLEELGLKSNADASPPKLSSELLFNDSVALNYDRDKAASTLAWLYARNMVQSVTWPDASSPYRISRTTAESGAGYGNELHVKRSHEWSWTADSWRKAGDITITRDLSLSEQWRGEATPRPWRLLAESKLSLTLEPGKVAILHAFPSGPPGSSGLGDMLPAQAARKGGYLPLLVIENHALDAPAPADHLGAKSSPVLAVPDGASPVAVSQGRFSPSLGPNMLQGIPPLIRVTPPAAVQQPTPAPAETAPSPNVIIVQLKNADASAMADLLSKVVKSTSFTAAADPRTNSVVISPGDRESKDFAEALLFRLDSSDAPGVATASSQTSPGRRQPGSAEKPSLEILQSRYAQLEAAAAAQARELRDFRAVQKADDKSRSVEGEERRLAGLLSQVVQQSFDARQALLAAELEALQARIETTRRSLELRNKAANEIVARRVQDLLDPELKWDHPEVAATAAGPSKPGTSVPVLRDGPATPPASPPFRSVSPRPGTLPSARGSGGKGGSEMLFIAYKLSHVAPGTIKSVLQALVPEAIVEANESQKSILVNAPKDRHDRIAAALKLLDQPGPLPPDSDPFSSPDPTRRSNPAERTSRRLSVKDLPVEDATAVLNHLKLEGSVGSSVDGAFVRVDATDEEFERLKALLDASVELARRAEQDQTNAQVLPQLSGIWEPQLAHGDMMGMGMEMGIGGELGGAIGSPFGAAPDAVSGQAAVIPRLVIHDGQAGLFEKNELKRRWTMQADGPSRYTFIAADGQGGMQATTSGKDPDQLSVVSVDQEGARIVRYHRTIAAVPPEWAAELAKGKAGPSRPSAGTRRSDLLRGITSGAIAPRAGAAQGDSGRNPSDYLELLKKYQTATVEYERLLKTVGAEHPDARKLRADRDRELKAVEILRQEFQMEFDNAVRALRLKKEEAVQAEETYMYLRRQVEKGTAQQGEFEKQRLVRDAARAALEAAEARVELFAATKSNLFPSAEPNAEGTVPPFNPSPPPEKVPSASPQTPSPTSAPATPLPAVPPSIIQR